ncbi:MAG: SDR family oxidoreductase [Candidatus Lernaella stagnicola]|nr:SDR family oxidoreductase [Candidatus Lernaella stagnicola]
MILVTGGAGFIGSHIVRALEKRGSHVRVLDNLSSGKRDNLSGVDAEIVVGDIRSETDVERAMVGVRVVFHQAAAISVPQTIADPAGTHSVNVEGTVNVLEKARQAGVERFVFASSAAVYGDEPSLPKSESSPLRPLSPYALHKIIGEQYLKLYHDVYGMDTISLRYFNIFGPRQDPNSPYAAAIPIFVAKLHGQQPPTIYGDGRQTRDFVYIDDAVAANLAAMETTDPAGRVFNVARGEQTDLLQLLELIGNAFGRRADPVFTDPRPGDVRHSVASIEAAAQELRYQPQVSLADGLAKTVRWLIGGE